MSYPLLSLLVVVSAAMISVLLVWGGSRPGWRALFTGLAGVSVLTAMFDPLIIYFGMVDYDPDTLLGPSVGPAPIEDFSYAIAAGLLGPAIYIFLRRSKLSNGDAPGEGHGEAKSERGATRSAPHKDLHERS